MTRLQLTKHVQHMVVCALHRGATALDEYLSQRWNSEPSKPAANNVRDKLYHVARPSDQWHPLMTHSTIIGPPHRSPLSNGIECAARVETHVLWQTAVPIHSALEPPGERFVVASQDHKYPALNH